jgi:hypothetical protein
MESGPAEKFSGEEAVELACISAMILLFPPNSTYHEIGA